MASMSPQTGAAEEIVGNHLRGIKCQVLDAGFEPGREDTETHAESAMQMACVCKRPELL